LVVASLVIAVLTLFLAVFIHSETREALGRINAISDTLPGAYDVKRVIRDMEDTKQRRGKVVCDAPKNTHVEYSMPAPDIRPAERRKNTFWRLIRKLASYWSGDIYESVVEESPKMGKWEVISAGIGTAELEKRLTEGWEPFSVTDSSTIWLRKYRRRDN
jgi:hypothetical protein